MKRRYCACISGNKTSLAILLLIVIHDWWEQKTDTIPLEKYFNSFFFKLNTYLSFDPKLYNLAIYLIELKMLLPKKLYVGVYTMFIHKLPQLETTKMFFKWWMGKTVLPSHIKILLYNKCKVRFNFNMNYITNALCIVTENTQCSDDNVLLHMQCNYTTAYFYFPYFVLMSLLNILLLHMLTYLLYKYIEMLWLTNSKGAHLSF